MKVLTTHFFLALLLMPFISGTSNASEACLDLFAKTSATEILDEQDVAEKKIAIQHLLNSAIKFIQTHITASSIRSTDAVKAQNKSQLNRFLSNGQSGKAIDIYRLIFDKVELAYHRITQDQATLQTLELSPGPNKSHISRLKRRIRKHQNNFAKHYGEYLSVRDYLEKSITDPRVSATFSLTAKDTLKFLGVHKFSEVHKDYASLKIPEQRVSIPEIKALFRSDRLYTRIKLWSDFKSEIVSVMKYIISSEVVVGTIDNVFNRFPPKTAEKLKRFTGILKSAKLRFRHLQVIIDIESLPPDPELRLVELRRNNSITPNDELLVTYARTVEFLDSWSEMLAHAETQSKTAANESQKARYKNIYDRMMMAQDKALGMPDISVAVTDSNIDHLIVIIQTAVVLKIAGPTTFATLNDFYSFVGSVIP